LNSLHNFNKEQGFLKPSEMHSFDDDLLRKTNGSNFNSNEDPNKLNSTSSSMFSDIKEVLKAVEYSKSKIEAENVTEHRDRNNTMFYVLNSTGFNK
jgi:hypothetical protein